MPLEALRYPVTPIGLHYLLIHFDVPDVDPGEWSLTVHGERELTLDLDALKERPRQELTVTMECAGNGRARLDPRPVSQPWLLEAVGTARWGGAAARRRGRGGGRRRGALHRPRPGHRRRHRAALPAQPLARGSAQRRPAPRLRDERPAAPAATRFPAAPRRPRLVRDDQRQVADRDRGDPRAVHRLPAAAGVPDAAGRRRGGHADRADRAALAVRAARDP